MRSTAFGTIISKLYPLGVWLGFLGVLLGGTAQWKQELSARLFAEVSTQVAHSENGLSDKLSRGSNVNEETLSLPMDRRAQL